MAILDQLFGINQQNPQDTGGLVQSILSQRFQPSPDDINQATAQSAIQRNYVSPQQAMGQRIAPAMQVAGTLGNLNMTQIALAKLEEEQMRDRMMWGMEIGKLPQGAFPGMPPVGFGGGQQMQQQPQSGVGFPPPSTAQGNPNMSQSDQNSAMADLYPDSVKGGMSSPQGGEVPLTTSGGQRQPILSGFGQPVAVPEGPVMARDAQGNMSAMQIPGAPPKMENGMAITTDPKTGQPMQQVPLNPQARQRFETSLQEIHNLYEQLHQVGGTVEEGGSIGNNLSNTLAGSNFSFPLPGSEREIDLPGGQTVSRVMGTQSQSIRDHIGTLVKQNIMPYMQAVGATPGMERAFQAQMMLLQSLGSNPTIMRQSVDQTLADLSRQAGTGDLFKKVNSEEQPQGTPKSAAPKENGGRISIITPDGKPGTIDAAHLDDLIAAGGKRAQ